MRLKSYLPYDNDSELDCGMWWSDVPACEFDDENCLNSCGLYFGTMDSREPKFCAYHFFSMDMGYKIEPITEIVNGKHKPFNKQTDAIQSEVPTREM